MVTYRGYQLDLLSQLIIQVASQKTKKNDAAILCVAWPSLQFYCTLDSQPET